MNAANGTGSDNTISTKKTLPYISLISSLLIWGSIGIFRRAIPLSSSQLAFSRGVLGAAFLALFKAVSKTGGRFSRLFRPLTASNRIGEKTGEPSPCLPLTASNRIGEKTGEPSPCLEKTEEPSPCLGSRPGTRPAERVARRDIVLSIINGAVIGINWILLFEAYNYTTVSTATLCYYLQPTIVLLVSPVLLQEKMSPKKALCAALSLVGMLFVSGILESGDAATTDLRGVACGLGAACFYATSVIINKKITMNDAVLRTIIQMSSAAVCMLPYLALTNGFEIPTLTAVQVCLVVIVGIVHTGIAFALFFSAFADLKAQTIALLGYIDPVSALFFSAIFLGESLSFGGIVGAVLIIGSALLCEVELPRNASLDR